MNRVYWLYLLLLSLTMTVMSIVTHQLRMQERLDQLQSLTAENERLALWRIESKLLPLVIRESSRVYDDVLFDVGNPTELPEELMGCFRLYPDAKGTAIDWKQAQISAPEKEAKSFDWAKQIQSDCEQAVLVAAIETKASDKTIAISSQVSLSDQDDLRSETYLSNAMQQSARSELEYRSRSSNQSLNAELVNQLQSQAFSHCRRAPR